MIGLDTNVLVRYLMFDDADQSARAERLVTDAAERQEMMFVAQIVLCEVSWVLRRAYALEKAEVAEALSALLQTAQFVVEGAQSATRALRRFRGGSADFADYLVAERAHEGGCSKVATFDKKLLREPGFFRP